MYRATFTVDRQGRKDRAVFKGTTASEIFAKLSESMGFWELDGERDLRPVRDDESMRLLFDALEKAAEERLTVSELRRFRLSVAPGCVRCTELTKE